MKCLQACLILAVQVLVISATRRGVRFINCPSTKPNSNFIKLKPARSRIECSVICLNDPHCLSASYCKTTDGYTCQLSELYADGNCSEFAAGLATSHTVLVNPCENGATFVPQNRTCLCADGFVGDYCHRRYRDCEETPGWGRLYHIQPFGSDYIFEWKCRETYSVTETVYVLAFNYNHEWQTIRSGLPIVPGSFFFLGLESLHQLTKQGSYDMSVTLATVGDELGLVWYRNIRVDSEAEGYALHWDYFERGDKPYLVNVSIFQDGFGGAGDETKNLNGARFGTYDNDVNGCAAVKNIGWWYNPLGCMVLDFTPNGPYCPVNRNGTTVKEFLRFFKLVLWPVKMYVEDDLVL